MGAPEDIGQVGMTLLDLSPLAFMGFGFQELLLIAFVALLVFGGNLPDVMQQLGRTYGKFRQSLNELSRPVRNELRQIQNLPSPDRDTTRYGGGTPTTDEETEPLDHPKIETSPGDDLPDCIARTPDHYEELLATEDTGPQDVASGDDASGDVASGDIASRDAAAKSDQGKAPDPSGIDEPPPV